MRTANYWHAPAATRCLSRRSSRFRSRCQSSQPCLRHPKESGVPGVAPESAPSYREKLARKCTANYLGASPPAATQHPPRKGGGVSSDWSNGIVTPEITPSVTRTLSCFCAASGLLISRWLLVLGFGLHSRRHN